MDDKCLRISYQLLKHIFTELVKTNRLVFANLLSRPPPHPYICIHSERVCCQQHVESTLLMTSVCGPEDAQALKIHLCGIYLSQCVFLHTTSRNIIKIVNVNVFYDFVNLSTIVIVQLIYVCIYKQASELWI